MCSGTLSDVTFSGLSEDDSHGERILEALCDNELTTLKRLDISENPSWYAISYYSERIADIV